MATTNRMPGVSIEQQWHIACAEARDRSIAHQCTTHVNANCCVVDGCPQIISFTVSDWYADGATVTTFTEGRQHE